MFVASVSAQNQKADSNALKQVVRQAFESVHDGYSSDEVILQTELNDAFINACRQHLPDVQPFDLNWTLLNLRKSGKLDVKTTRRDRRETDQVRKCARG